MKEENALISVIVPVYNQEKYLDMCLKSILSQTYRRLEVIVVDDASTDRSCEIIDHYARQDDRIHLIRNTENRGPSYTRNAGIEIAKGGYIGFVDSDDVIEPAMFETLYALIRAYHADISGCRYNVLSGETDKKSPCDRSLPEAELISTEEAAKRLLLKKGCSDALWDKLYRASLFEDIRLTEGMVYEDQEVLLRIFAKAENIVLSNRKLYNYYRRPGSGSITQAALTEKRHDLLTARSCMYKTVTDSFPALEQAARERYLEAALKYLHDAGSFPEEKRIRKETRAEISDFIKEKGGVLQRKDIMLCLIAMKTNMRLFDLLFEIRERK